MFFVLAVLALGLTTSAHAQDGHHGSGHEQFHPWYETLKDPAGIPCCHGEDCRPTQDRISPEDQKTVQVLVDGEWEDVPPEKILKKTSPDLGSHVCATNEADEYPPKGSIRCVVLGNGV